MSVFVFMDVGEGVGVSVCVFMDAGVGVRVCVSMDVECEGMCVSGCGCG